MGGAGHDLSNPGTLLADASMFVLEIIFVLRPCRVFSVKVVADSHVKWSSEPIRLLHCSSDPSAYVSSG